MRVLTEANIEFRSVALSGGSYVMVGADVYNAENYEAA